MRTAEQKQKQAWLKQARHAAEASQERGAAPRLLRARFALYFGGPVPTSVEAAIFSKRLVENQLTAHPAEAFFKSTVSAYSHCATLPRATLAHSASSCG